jgi:hypothetical protein
VGEYLQVAHFVTETLSCQYLPVRHRLKKTAHVINAPSPHRSQYDEQLAAEKEAMVPSCQAAKHVSMYV